MPTRLGAAGTPPPPGPEAWDYLAACFARDQVCLSFGLWLLAALFWIAAHVLCFYLGCSKRPGGGRSVPCVIYRLVGSLSDAVGALLSGQLPIQVFTGIHLAAMEVVDLLFLLFPICGSKMKPKSGRRSQDRPRKNFQAGVFVVLVPLGVATGWLTLAPPAPEFHAAQRRLLGSVLQENTAALGYALGGVGLLVSWTSRIPSFSRLYRGRALPGLQQWARGFSALAGFLYASAIVAHDRQPDYLRRAAPWFLISLGASSLDLALIFLSCVMQSKMRRVLGFSLETAEPPDTQALLTRTRDCDGQEDEEEAEEDEEKSTSWVPLHMLPHTTYLQKMAAIGRYMELTIEHVQEVGCSSMRFPADGRTSARDPLALLEPPAYPPIRVIHAKVASSSSSEVSSIDSELEQKYWEALNAEQWDPEDAPPAGPQ